MYKAAINIQMLVFMKPCSDCFLFFFLGMGHAFLFFYIAHIFCWKLDSLSNIASLEIRFSLLPNLLLLLFVLIIVVSLFTDFFHPFLLNLYHLSSVDTKHTA